MDHWTDGGYSRWSPLELGTHIHVNTDIYSLILIHMIFVNPCLVVDGVQGGYGINWSRWMVWMNDDQMYRWLISCSSIHPLIRSSSSSSSSSFLSSSEMEFKSSSSWFWIKGTRQRRAKREKSWAKRITWRNWTERWRIRRTEWATHSIGAIHTNGGDSIPFNTITPFIPFSPLLSSPSILMPYPLMLPLFRAFIQWFISPPPSSAPSSPPSLLHPAPPS